jgi:hypothetical protein
MYMIFVVAMKDVACRLGWITIDQNYNHRHNGTSVQYQKALTSHKTAPQHITTDIPYIVPSTRSAIPISVTHRASYLVHCLYRLVVRQRYPYYHRGYLQSGDDH